MSIKPRGVLIDSNLYTKTEWDILYNGMVDYLFSSGAIKEIFDPLKQKEEFGEDNSYEYEQLFYLQQIIQYFILLKHEANQQVTSQDTLETLLETYKISCIRETALCRFSLEKYFDGLLSNTGIGFDGLDFMILEGYFENPPFLIP